MIYVRSLRPVGGTRPGRSYTRRNDRLARSRGFRNFAAFVAFMARRLVRTN